jgi:hypothetical protein
MLPMHIEAAWMCVFEFLFKFKLGIKEKAKEEFSFALRVF